jgi:signal recognition particle subunit SRP54
MKEKIQQAYSVPGTSKQKTLRRVRTPSIFTHARTLARTTNSHCAHQVVVEELTALVDPQQGGGGVLTPARAFQPIKNRPNVIMFVGLQGAGKTTTVAKLARHYKQRRWRVGMVCADTFRAGAGPQLLGLGRAIKLPVNSDVTSFDPVEVAQKGVELFKKEGCEIIIVDTSGRHKQETALFEEMEQLVASVVHLSASSRFISTVHWLTRLQRTLTRTLTRTRTRTYAHAHAQSPDLITYVLDGTIGQMAYDQVSAFKQRVSIGSIIVTKLDGHGKGGGALSAYSSPASS